MAAEHHPNCANNPVECFYCQMSKLADGIFSGRYSKEPEKTSEGEEEEQKGIPPRMLKSLICRNHEEFSTNRQQDAYEFFQHLLKITQQQERVSGLDPSKSFQYELQQRLQCSTCGRVRYSSVKQTELSLPIPLEAAIPPVTFIEEEKADERAKREFQSKVPITACIDSFISDEVIEFHCSHCNKKTDAIKNYRFSSFPSNLVIHTRRFVFEDWVPRKLAIQLEVPDILNLERTRGHGKQSDEVALPEIEKKLKLNQK